MARTAGDDKLMGLLALIEPLLPAAELGEWTERARCTQTDPELWFPPKGDRGLHARAICARCEVRVQCLAYATVAAEHGIWGGVGRDGRRRLLEAYLARHLPAATLDKEAG